MIGSPLESAVEAPGRGWHWGAEAWHSTLRRGEWVKVRTIGSQEGVVPRPSSVPNRTMNLVGALRRVRATTGYTDVKEFQKVELVLG